jgi:hypothetical protein
VCVKPRDGVVFLLTKRGVDVSEEDLFFKMPLAPPSVKAGSAYAAVGKAAPQKAKPSSMLQELESFERSVSVIQVRK